MSINYRWMVAPTPALQKALERPAFLEREDLMSQIARHFPDQKVPLIRTEDVQRAYCAEIQKVKLVDHGDPRLGYDRAFKVALHFVAREPSGNDFEIRMRMPMGGLPHIKGLEAAVFEEQFVAERGEHVLELSRPPRIHVCFREVAKSIEEHGLDLYVTLGPDSRNDYWMVTIIKSLEMSGWVSPNAAMDVCRSMAASIGEPFYRNGLGMGVFDRDRGKNSAIGLWQTIRQEFEQDLVANQAMQDLVEKSQAEEEEGLVVDQSMFFAIGAHAQTILGLESEDLTKFPVVMEALEARINIVKRCLVEIDGYPEKQHRMMEAISNFRTARREQIIV